MIEALQNGVCMDKPEPWRRVVVCLRHQQFLEWCRQNGERASQHIWVGDPSSQALRGHRFEIEDIIYTGEQVSDERYECSIHGLE